MVDIVGSLILLATIIGLIVFTAKQEQSQQDAWTCECTQMEARGGEAVCTERICRRKENAGE